MVSKATIWFSGDDLGYQTLDTYKECREAFESYQWPGKQEICLLIKAFN